MNKKLLIAIIITSIIALSFIGVMFKMIQENGECIDDPFRYSATKLKESGGNYHCFCNSFDPELLDFYFDENGITIETPQNHMPLTIPEIKFNTGVRG
jgi:hypothetical protein